MPSNKPLAQLKHIERRSRQTRHYRTHLNHIYDQQLHRELTNLTNEYEFILKRSKTDQNLEQQRKEFIGITIQQIAHERKRQPSSKTPIQRRPSSPSQTSCRLFSQDCQLYPCQPIYHYTSFLKKEHDQTLRYRKNQNPNLSSAPSQFETLISNIQNQKHQGNNRQLAITIQNQYHLANRHAHIERTMTLLDHQSQLLHQRLADKKTFGFVKDKQHELKQSIQRHLEISAKFCG